MYINSETQKTYVSEYEVFQDYPNVSFPITALVSAFAELGIYKVNIPEAPLADMYHTVELLPPYFDQEAGEWKAIWHIINREPTPQEIEREKERILETLTECIQNYLDAKPKTRLYDGILSLCTYATSANPKFAAEGQAGVNWRDVCWSRGYEIMADVQQGLRPIPTEQELLGELPALVWPDEAIYG